MWLLYLLTSRLTVGVLWPHEEICESNNGVSNGRRDITFLRRVRAPLPINDKGHRVRRQSCLGQFHYIDQASDYRVGIDVLMLINII